MMCLYPLPVLGAGAETWGRTGPFLKFSSKYASLGLHLNENSGSNKAEHSY